MNRLATLSPPAAEETDLASTTCIRTDAEGRVPLGNNCLPLFNEAAQRFDALYFQTCHSHARLVARVKDGSIALQAKSHGFLSADKSLELRPQRDCQIFGRIQRCPCCHSPGRIEFLSGDGREFMQICPSSAISAIAWARYVETLSSLDDGPAEPFPARPSAHIGADAALEEWHPSILVSIFDWLGHQAVASSVTLVTKESVHRRRILPRDVFYHEDLLSVYSAETSFQLHLPAIRSFHLTRDSSGFPEMLLGGRDQTLLFAIGASADPASRSAWDGLFQHVAPEF